MIQFKVNGKKIEVFSCWEDLTLNQYCNISKKGGDILKEVCTHSRIDYEVFKNSRIEGLESLILTLSFIKKPPVIPEYVPTIGKYSLPATKDGKFDITLESLAQFEDMKALIKKLPDNDLAALTDSFPEYVAIYLQKIRDGEYNYNKAKEMVEEVRNMKAVEVISLGSFFLIKLLNLVNGTTVNSQPTNPSQKKLKRATTSSRKHSASTARSRKRR